MYRTEGVFPDPPIIALPTAITGIGALLTLVKLFLNNVPIIQNKVKGINITAMAFIKKL